MSYVSDVVIVMSEDGEDTLYVFLEGNEREIENKVTSLLHKSEQKNISTEDHVFIIRNVDKSRYMDDKAMQFLSRMRHYVSEQDYFYLEIPKTKDALVGRIPWKEIVDLL